MKAENPIEARVTGIVSYRERAALLLDEFIKVQLADVSRADAPAEVIARQHFKAGASQVPLLLKIGYDPAMIKLKDTYTVRHWPENTKGRLRFTTDQRYAVITRGAPTHVDLVLKTVSMPSPR